MIRKISTRILVSAIILLNVYHLQAAVDTIIGDTGTAQSGALKITGGTSGLIFDSTTTNIIGSFNFVSMPLTTSVVGQVIIGSERVLHTFGTGNQNIFVGGSAGNFVVSGGENTGCGNSALNSLTTGSQNTACGDASLINLTTGGGNTAVGEFAGGGLISGNNNILIGNGAGSAYDDDESGNIIIGANPGVEAENNIIRIGSSGMQTACYIDGIFDGTVEVDTGTPVVVDSDGKLGTIISSDAFKFNIENIKAEDSARILQLRPITYYFKGDKTKTLQYGLIAEEVNQIIPELVIKQKGRPHSVRYHELPVLLLHVMQKLAARMDKLELEQ